MTPKGHAIPSKTQLLSYGTPAFCGALLRQREAERIRRAISFARALDASCSGVSPR